MKILIVSYVDDNFGDNLIRICFENILKVVLKNLNIENYEISRMHLKKVDSSLICQSDIIFFAGGGLFGLSYLNFFDYLDEITRIADEHHIPVIFSSIGVNNMDATAENEDYLKNILKRKCIKYVAVRENISLFQSYAGSDSHFQVEQVCDPAVWTKYINFYQNSPNVENEKPIIGINVVRGGLFKDNNKKWFLSDELNYLNDLRKLLDDAGIDYKFYTNGSFLDNNTLHYFAKEFSIPDEHLIFSHSTREFVQAIQSFDSIVAIRMHSAIVSYAFDIPSVCLIWNDKILLFYENINKNDYAISIDEWNANNVFEKVKLLLENKDFHKDEAYLMTVYQYLFKVLSQLYDKDSNMFNFSQVAEEISKLNVPIDEDLFDYRLKCDKAEFHYLARFTELRESNKEIKALKNTVNEKDKKISEQKQKIEIQAKKLDEQDNQISRQKDLILSQNQILQRQKARLDHIDNLFVVRVYHKITRIFKKVFSN